MNRMTTIRHATIAAACLAALASTGCRDKTAEAQATEEAADILLAGGNPTGNSTRPLPPAELAQAVIAKTRSVARDAPEQPAAALMTAAAERTQAAIALGTLIEAADRVAEAADRATSHAQRAALLSAEAAAILAADPTTENEIIRADVVRLDSEIAERTTQIGREESEIARLRQSLAGLQARSSDKRDQAAGLSLRAAGMTAVQAAELSPQIQSLTRQADAIDMDAGRTQGQIDALVPRLEESRLLLEQKQQERALAAAEIERRIKLRDDARARSSELRDQAASEARSAAEAATEALSIAESDLDTAEQEALSRAGAARSAAATAKRSARGFGAAAEVAVHDQHGRIYAVAAGAHEHIAVALNRIAAVRPEVPGAAGFAASAQDAQAATDQHLTDAAQAFRDAASALQSGQAAANAARRNPLALGTPSSLAASIQSTSANYESLAADLESRRVNDPNPVDPAMNGAFDPSADPAADPTAQPAPVTDPMTDPNPNANQ